MSALPPFPVDDTTLDLLWSALHPDPEVSDRSTVTDLCVMLSELGGSDTTAVAEQDGDVRMMRDPQYTAHDILAALVEEVRRLRPRPGGNQ